VKPARQKFLSAIVALMDYMLTTAVLTAGVLVAFGVGLRVYVREKTLTPKKESARWLKF